MRFSLDIVGLWLQLASLPCLQGYCEDLQATANCFAGDFYLTGDRGSQDEVRELEGRKQERIDGGTADGRRWSYALAGWIFLVLLSS